MIIISIIRLELIIDTVTVILEKKGHVKMLAGKLKITCIRNMNFKYMLDVIAMPV